MSSYCRRSSVPNTETVLLSVTANDQSCLRADYITRYGECCHILLQKVLKWLNSTVYVKEMVGNFAYWHEIVYFKNGLYLHRSNEGIYSLRSCCWCLSKCLQYKRLWSADFLSKIFGKSRKNEAWTESWSLDTDNRVFIIGLPIFFGESGVFLIGFICVMVWMMFHGTLIHVNSLFVAVNWHALRRRHWPPKKSTNSVAELFWYLFPIYIDEKTSGRMKVLTEWLDNCMLHVKVARTSLHCMISLLFVREPRDRFRNPCWMRQKNWMPEVCSLLNTWHPLKIGARNIALFWFTSIPSPICTLLCRRC